MGLVGLAATGICSMMGAAINVIPLMVQRSVPGIGPWVLPAYLVAVVPALLAALAYATLASAMPRAGGSYIYASRALHPYLGFVASFSQWFGLSIAMGVVAYLVIPFVRDVAAATGFPTVAESLMSGPIRVGVALAFIWIFTAVNLLGLKVYERTLIPLMIFMFLCGSVVIFAGFTFDHADFAAGVLARDGASIDTSTTGSFRLSSFLAASVLLFSSFIGFDSIAQAGGEAKNPSRNLPIAIAIAIFTVGGFYILFTAAIYHAVPWQYVAERAMTEDLTAPGLLGYLMPPGWTVLIVAGAAIALINDLPAMLLAVSRLMFAWAEDGIFPRFVTAVSSRFRTPWVAIVLSSGMASVGILGCHFAGDFFLGVDLLVTAMLVNFLLMCLSLVFLHRNNPELAARARLLEGHGRRTFVGVAGAALLSIYLVVHVGKDLSTDLPAWYFHSTWLWLLVMAVATVIFALKWARVSGDPDARQRFRELPPQ
jgi:APA family basic amino acid/polyamine antiporter